MKIANTTQQPVTSQEIDKVGQKTAAGGLNKKAAAKGPRQGDTVELSSALDAELRAQESQRAQRVETIKSLVRAGKYKVDSREVAEKMLSDKAGG
jgi:flagellar biosynthesis anti-sigma factor FlgM